ncbi:MAG: hypothetical protein R3C17_13275 [Planctomycetaceae bacterium]
MSRRSIAIFAVVFAMIVIGAAALHRYMDETYRNYSALCVTEAFLKFHLSASLEPDFPESWTTIAEEYDAFCAKTETSFALAELQHRVTINWRTGKQYIQQRTATDKQLAIITLVDGSTVRWHGDDPNANVIRFIQEMQRPVPGK